MKTKLLLMITVLTITACNSGGGSTGGGTSIAPTCATSSLIGQYQNIGAGDFVNIYNDCTGDGLVCNVQFGFTLPSSSGSTVLTINVTDGVPGCLPLGPHNCQFSDLGTSIMLNCPGFGVLAWDRL